jgi:putative membrane protein
MTDIYSTELNIQTHGVRLSPLSMIYQSIRQLPGLAITFYVALSGGSGENWIYIVIALIYGLFVFPVTLLNFYYFKYLLTNKELVIHSGILSKKQRNIPLERIQNVNITQNFIQRIFGISKVQIETAGDASAEGVLDSVKTSRANEIKLIIKEFQGKFEQKKNISLNETTNKNIIEDDFKSEDFTNNNINEPNGISSNNEEEELIRMSVKELVIYGFLRFRPILFVLFAWIYSIGQQFMPSDIHQLMEDFVYDVEALTNSLDWFLLTIYFIGFFIVAFILSWLLDVLLTVNQWWNFRLSIEKNKLYTNHGLLNRRSGTIPLKKLQMLVIFSNVIRQKFGYWGLMLETAGLSSLENRRPETAVPFAKFDKVIELSKGILNFEFPFEFEKVSRKTIRRAFIRYLIFLVIITFAAYLFDLSYYWFLFLMPLLYFGAVLRWQHRGWQIQNDKIIIKQGFFSRRIKIVPINKIQTINVKRTFFQRRLQLASLHIDTAASSGINDASIIDIDEKDAISLMEVISKRFHILN